MPQTPELNARWVQAFEQLFDLLDQIDEVQEADGTSTSPPLPLALPTAPEGHDSYRSDPPRQRQQTAVHDHQETHR